MSQIKAFVYAAGAAFLLLLQGIRMLSGRTAFESLFVGTLLLCVFAIAEKLDNKEKTK